VRGKGHLRLLHLSPFHEPNVSRLLALMMRLHGGAGTGERFWGCHQISVAQDSGEFLPIDFDVEANPHPLWPRYCRLRDFEIFVEKMEKKN
jgi:hypothetical protein